MLHSKPDNSEPRVPLCPRTVTPSAPPLSAVLHIVTNTEESYNDVETLVALFSRPSSLRFQPESDRCVLTRTQMGRQ